MADEDNGNGHQDEPTTGAILDLADLKRLPPLIAAGNGQNPSLLHRLISADWSNVADQFLTALFRNSDEADQAVAAYIECKDLGLDPEPVLLQITARSAGMNLQYVRLIMEGLTHSTFNISKGKDGGNDRNRSSIRGAQSPLA